MNGLNILFEQKGDVVMNDVDFHSCLLKTIPYFEKQFSMNNFFEFTVFSKSATQILKRYLYGQEIKIDDWQLYLELVEMERYLMIDMELNKLVKELEKYIPDDIKIELISRGYEFKFPEKLTQEQINIISSNDSLYEKYLATRLKNKHPYNNSKYSSYYYLQIEYGLCLYKQNKNISHITYTFHLHDIFDRLKTYPNTLLFVS